MTTRPSEQGCSSSNGEVALGPEPPIVCLAGGDLLNALLPERTTAYEELYRTLPEEAWFDGGVNPSRPVQFEVGAYTVPKGQSLWLFEWSFTPYRFSGVGAGDAVPLERGRLTSVIGFDVTANTNRRVALNLQLDPSPVGTGRSTGDTLPSPFGVAPFGVPPATGTATFNRQAFQAYSLGSSHGTALLPPREGRAGPQSGPFTWVIPQGYRVVFTAVIFRPVPIPLAFLEARHAGYSAPYDLTTALLARMRLR